MKLNAVVCLSIALIPLFDQGSTSVGFEPVGLWNHLFMFRTKSRLCLWLGAGLLLMTIIWLKGHNRATNSEVGSYSHFRDDLQVNCLKVYIVAGLASSRQQLLEEFFRLRLEACLNFIAGAQYKSVMDEYLQRVTNGFTVLEVMKAILEMAHFHGLMCALSTKQLLH